MKPKATRQAFGEALAELGAEFKNIVVCDADLSKSTKSEMFQKKFPERFYQIGIAEANMIGTGAGLALSGLTPFICSFGCFVTGRYDQIRMSVAYANAPVRIIGTHSGIGIGDDGHSQMGLEDIALLRELPGFLVLQPADEIETKQMMRYLVSDPEALTKPAYIRLTRQNLKSVHDQNYQWQLAKPSLLKKGSGVALLATGATVQECLAASERLSEKKIEVSVYNVATLKPFGQELLKELAANHQQIITVEDHYVVGGLGSCVAEAIADQGLALRLTRLGVQDRFGESGDPQELYEKFGFSAYQIYNKVLKLVN